MLDLLLKFHPDVLLMALSYVLMAVLALLAVAQRATYWILLIVLALALYFANVDTEPILIIVLGAVAWLLLWQGVSNRNRQSTTNEGA